MGRGAEAVQVQVSWATKDLRVQEVGLHQVGQRGLRGDESQRSACGGRRERQVSSGARPSLSLVQGPGPAGRCGHLTVFDAKTAHMISRYKYLYLIQHVLVEFVYKLKTTVLRI